LPIPKTDQYLRRSWEGFGADPYLSAVAVRTSVEAFQKNNVHGHVKVRFLLLSSSFSGANFFLPSFTALLRQRAGTPAHLPILPEVSLLTERYVRTQEKYRYGIEEGFYGGFIFNQTISSDIDAATVRETYTFAFAEAVRFVFPFLYFPSPPLTLHNNAGVELLRSCVRTTRSTGHFPVKTTKSSTSFSRRRFVCSLPFSLSYGF
jgi:hypothetical protein